MKLVSEADEVAGVAAAIERASLVAFDLEFASADRLVPTLCLMQVAWLEEHVSLDAPAAAIVAAPPEVRLVDPMAVDAGPIARAIAAHPMVVAHAPRQDLALLATRFGTEMAGLVDTQLMAAFCGIGEQVGLATLAGELLGLSLAKEQQWTDWAARPLSAEQLAYADADVRHLPAMYARLAARLGPKVAWVREESAAIVEDALAAARVTPETAWQYVSGARGLDVAELAAWRQRVAIELDRPLGQVMTDKVMVELARRRPESAQAVRSTKGMSPIAKTRADEIVAAISATALEKVEKVEKVETVPTEMILAIVRVVAQETGIAARLLATRADAEEIARALGAGGIEAARALPAFATWRREVLGTTLEGWLLGRIAIVGDLLAPHGFRLVPR